MEGMARQRNQKIRFIKSDGLLFHMHEIVELLLEAPESDWIRKGREFYDKNGYYSAKFLLKLLGDINKSVEVSEQGVRKAFSECLGYKLSSIIY